jgi:hypothetical protein
MRTGIDARAPDSFSRGSDDRPRARLTVPHFIRRDIVKSSDRDDSER